MLQVPIPYYEPITGVCCTDPEPDPFPNKDNATEWCDKDPKCMFIYSETRSENELFLCRKGTLVDSGGSQSYVYAKSKICFFYYALYQNEKQF